MKVFGVVTIASAIIGTLVTAGAAAPLSLQDCIVQAIHHSPALSAARHDTQAAREGVTQQRGALMPSLSAQASAYEVNGAPTTPFSALRVFDAENPRQKNAHWGPVGLESIGVSYPLIQNGSILGLNNPPELAAARAAVDEKLAGILLVEQKVTFDTVTAYSYATWYRNEAALASRIVQLSQERLDIIKYQTELQLRLPQDVELASAQVAAARYTATAAKRNADDSLAALSALIGRPDSDIAIDLNPQSSPALPPLREFMDHVMPSHPALRVQQGQVEIAQEQVRIKEAALWPSVKLNFGLAGAQSLEHFQGNTLSNFLSFIQVDIPIFDFGMRRAAVRASKEQVASSIDSLKAIELQLRNSIAQTYHEILDLDEQLATLQTDVLKASNAAALTRAQREQGLVDELSWVEAQIQVSLAEIVLGQMQLLTQLKYAELRNLSGGLWNWLDTSDPSSAVRQQPEKTDMKPTNVALGTARSTSASAARIRGGSALGVQSQSNAPSHADVAPSGPNTTMKSGSDSAQELNPAAVVAPPPQQRKSLRFSRTSHGNESLPSTRNYVRHSRNRKHSQNV